MKIQSLTGPIPVSINIPDSQNIPDVTIPYCAGALVQADEGESFTVGGHGPYTYYHKYLETNINHPTLREWKTNFIPAEVKFVQLSESQPCMLLK